MPHHSQDPADIRMMGIVHGALRRDLERCRLVLGSAPYPGSTRRRALAAHVLWLMHFLHRHHTAEDAGLWPAVRTKNPSAAALLDQMEADHATIAPAISHLESAAASYGEDATARDALLGRLEELGTVLLPHLAREEAEMMPIVAMTLTEGESRTIEKRHNIATKSFLELGDEGHWLLDGLDEEGRDVVVHLVPVIPRLILLHGFARRYQRKVQALWGGSPAADVPSLRLAPARPGHGSEGHPSHAADRTEPLPPS